MSWPLSHEFNEAVQNPQVVFSDPDLKGGETVVGATGLPLPRSGNFADVYQVRGADGREWAVKCFTRPVVGLAERYAKLSDALAKAELPFAVGFAYLAEGIRVGGAWRPIVKMEWVEGLLLNQVARENAGKPKVLLALGQMWAKLCKRLREAGIAHADIQHGNVLLVPGSRTGAYGLKLIDYDGMWVPALANTPSGESGHPSYQHPARASTRTYSPDVDRFPHLVAATALKGLSVCGSALWEKYDNGDNLLFTESDYKNPSESKVMKELWHAGAPALQSLVGRLAIACGKPIPQTPWLDHLAPEGEPSPLDDATRREAAAALGISLPVPAALPPEPVVELPPEPAYVVEPEPAPEPEPEPDPEPAPAPVFEAVFAAATDDSDRDRDNDRRPAKKSKKPKKRKGEEDAPKKSPILLFAGGGLLLLVGGVVAGVLIAGGKKPTETVQQKEEPKAPKERSADPVGPRPKQPDPVGPKPKDKLSDPVVLKPKDPEVAGPGPVVPPVVGAPPDRGPKQPDPVILGHPSDPTFKDLAPDGGYLIGLEVGLGRFGPNDVIHSLRPIYRTGDKETRGEQRGPNLPRVVTLKAKDGYAIGAVTIRTGLGLDGMSVTFMKLADGKLDPKEAYESEWAGGRGGYAQVTIGDGTPIVGIIGRADGRAPGDTHGLGVLLKGQEAFDPAKAPVIIGGGNNPRFQDLAPEGGLLIGLEFGLVKLGQNDHIQAARPIYRVNGKELSGAQRGMNLARVVTLKARDGYAVGGLTCKIGMNFDGCSLTFMRVKPDGTLDPTDSYASEWAGLNINIISVKHGGDGTPVVGISGRATDKQLHGLGLLFKGQEGFDGGGGAVAAKPPDPAPGAPPKAGELTLRWSVPIKGKARGGVRFDRDGRTIAVLHGDIPWSLDAYNAQDGKPVRDLPNLKGNATAPMPLDKGKFAYWGDTGRALVIWDTVTGKTTSRQFPQTGAGSPFVSVAPGGRYAVVGAHDPGPSQEIPETPFRVIDLTTGAELFSKTWRVGKALFTADSSRVLTADDAGSFRWFKLPKGEADGGWSFDLKSDGFNARNVSLSGDGSLVLYEGVVPGKERTYHLLDGKTGEILRSLPTKRYVYSGSLSDDGEFVAILRNDGSGTGHSAEVLNRRGEVLVSVRIPGAGGVTGPYVTLAWQGRTLLLAAREEQKLSLYDLGVPAPKAP